MLRPPLMAHPKTRQLTYESCSIEAEQITQADGGQPAIPASSRAQFAPPLLSSPLKKPAPLIAI